MAERTRVLVTYASKMGSTQEIAEAIGRELEAFGMQVTVAPCADNVNPDSFDGVIIGSAIYTRRWVKAATKYLKRHAHRLDRHKTWLFHSGPCGEGAREEQVQAPKAVERVIGPLELPAPVTFGGRLDVEHATGPVSRWMGSEGPLSGDFRDWDRIRAWAADIAHQLNPATRRNAATRAPEKFSGDGWTDGFRPISPTRCQELLESQSIGRVAWQAADGPQVLPVTYACHDGTIIFRTSPHGVLSELVRPTDVALEIDELDQESRQGWSVVVHGRAQGIAEPDQLVRMWTVGGVVPWASGVRNVFIQIIPHRITGRIATARSS